MPESPKAAGIFSNWRANILMKYSEHWEFLKMFFSSHKYNLSSSHPPVTQPLFIKYFALECLVEHSI